MSMFLEQESSLYGANFMCCCGTVSQTKRFPEWYRVVLSRTVYFPDFFRIFPSNGTRKKSSIVTVSPIWEVPFSLVLSCLV